MVPISNFLRAELGASSVDWAALSVGVLALAVTLVVEVYGAVSGIIA